MTVKTAQHYLERQGQALLLRWQRLTEPASEIEDPQERRQASLLAALTLGLLVLSLLTVTSFLVTDISQHATLPLAFASVDLIAIALLVMAYKASRTRRFWIGGALIVGMTYGATLSLALVTPQDADKVAPYFILSLLLCSMLFPLRRTLIYAAIIVLTLPLLPVVNSQIAIKNITYAVTSVLTATGLIVVWVHQRNLIEADRRAARKKVEDALAYERDLLSTLMNSIPDAIYYKDTRGRYLRINTAQATYLGVDAPADAQGKTAADFFAPGLSQQDQEDDEVIVATGRPMPDRVQNLTLPDGQQVWISVNKAPILDPEGRVRGIVAVARNITDGKRARTREMRLMELEQLQRTVAALFLQSGDPDIVINNTLRLVGEFLDVSSTDVFQLRDDSIADNTHGWSAPGVGFKFLREADLMRVSPSFLPVLARDGLLVADDVSELPVDTFDFLNEAGIQSLLAMPFHVDGRLHGFITVAEKRRRRNWVPEEIAAVRNIAESFGRVLERQHSQTALIQARDAALHSAKLKSQFMSNMSHEVRTPMTGVLGMLELLCETELDEDQREFATTAYSSAKNLLHLLDDILDFAKIEAGRVLLESKPMDVAKILKDVETTFAAQAEQKHLKFVTAIGDKVPRVAGDPTRLRQVLMNLTSNAIKFTNEGSISISVGQVSSIQGHTRLRFEVSDTGIGIDARQQQSIFDSFVQADGTITRKFGGTGLGLAICKQLVELMGGELGVESAIGRGSTFSFTITLPIARIGTDTGEYAGLISLRALVVDSDEGERTVLSQQLRLWGVDVTEAASLFSIEDLRSPANRQPFDIVFYHGEQSLTKDTVAFRGSPGKPLVVVRLSDGTGPVTGPFDTTLQRPVQPSALFDLLASIQEESGPLDSLPADFLGPGEAFARILLAEDSPINQRIVTKALHSAQLKVDVAQDGEEAVALLRQNNYRLILMDIHMPNLDGLMATRRIRAMEGPISKIPIIAVTASVLEEEEQRYREAGMNGMLSKPFTVAQLRSYVKHWLAESAVQAKT